MRLVDILARELKEWPVGYCDVGQADDGSLHLPGIGQHEIHTAEKYTKAEDWRAAIVTRTEWQAAVDALRADECAHSYGNNHGCPECGESRIDLPSLHLQQVGRIKREWNCEGLPPVGTVCEFQGDCAKCPSDPWHKELHDGVQCTVIAHFKSKSLDLVAFTFVKADGNSELEQSLPGALRPIRTPEQIAADQYEEDAAEIAKILSDLKNADEIFIAKTLLDCGYRKFEIVDN